MTIADHIGLGLGLGLVTALGGPDLRNGGPLEWQTLTPIERYISETVQDRS